MNISNFCKLSVFLMKCSRLPNTQREMSGVAGRKDCCGSDGNLYDVYLPARKKTNKVILVLHGISINGKNDMRLIHFSKCLAQQGVISVVPNLPGLAEGDFQIKDVAVLKSLIKDISTQYRQPVGIIGFSFGGSYALLAATNEDISPGIDFIVTFGACYSLKMMLRNLVSQGKDPLSDDDRLNNRIYTQLFYARRYHQELHIDQDTYRDMESLLKRYCHEATIDEKKKYYFNKMIDLNLPQKALESYDENVLTYLSLDGKMNKVSTKVSLIHDKNDTLVLPEQSTFIYEELMKTTGNKRNRLLLTSLISHVVPGRISIAEVISLYKSLEFVFAESRTRTMK